jgi:hypothetical protein
MSTTTFVYCHKPQPGQVWQAYEKTSGMLVFADSQAEAVAEFEKLWDFRAPIEWVYAAPPLPKGRPEDPKPSTAIEGDTIAAAFHRALLKAFHSDHHGHRSYTGDEIVTTINRLWDEAGAK